MLMASHVTHFNTQETTPQSFDPELQAMTDPLAAYHNSEIN